MPKTRVYLYRDERDRVPILEWMGELKRRNRRALARCVAAIRVLAESGHELRRPLADYLRDGIYELRIKERRVHYRLLYFFHGKEVAVLSHGFTKEDKVPSIEIERAIARKLRYEKDPQLHRATLAIQSAEDL